MKDNNDTNKSLSNFLNYKVSQILIRLGFTMDMSADDCPDNCRDETYGTTIGLLKKNVSFGNVTVKRKAVLNVIAAILLTVLAIAGLLRINSTHRFTFPSQSNTSNAVASVKPIKVSSGTELMEHLKQYDLWEIEPGTAVNPVLLTSFPASINQMETIFKKKAFFHSMLPVAMIALAEVERERTALKKILKRFDVDYSKLDFSRQNVLVNNFSKPEEEIILYLSGKYRTSNAAELLNRINVVPVSLILSQSAIESSWGGSRFALEGNNLFGIWTWGEKGIIPAQREEGMRHKVAIYPSILESVRAYILTLNRLPAYKTFRKIRNHTMDPFRLADGLLNYSERRDLYVRDVKRVINANNLDQYDSNTLDNFQLEASEQLSFTYLLRKYNAPDDAITM